MEKHNKMIGFNLEKMRKYEGKTNAFHICLVA